MPFVTSPPSILCLFVRLHISKTTSKLHQIVCPCYLWLWFSPHLTTWCTSTLWLTSCFHIMDDMVCCVGSIDVGAVLQQVLRISSLFARERHTVWLCCCIQWQQNLANCTLGDWGHSLMSMNDLFACAIKKVAKMNFACVAIDWLTF